MKLKEIAEKILLENRVPMHINEIARIAVSRNFFPDDSENNLSRKISSALSNDIKKNKQKSIFRRISNGKGGEKAGMYRIKRQTKTGAERVIQSISKKSTLNKASSSTAHIGKGGEYSVLSELLFNEYNANIMTMDDGIDIVASKNHKFFYIQVKTTYIKRDKVNTISINNKSFKRYENSNTFYVIVLRFYIDENTPQNHYLIIPSIEIERLVHDKYINDKGASLTMSIKIYKGKFYLIQKDNYHDLTYNFNNFSIIK